MVSLGPCSKLVLCAGTLPRTTFRDYVGAAASAGFDAVTVWPHQWRRARTREGLDLKEMRRLLEDHAIAVTDIETCADWFGKPPASGVRTPVRADIPRDEIFEVAAELGGRTVVAAALSGQATSDQAVDGFARLCDDAASWGLQVALEFVPFLAVNDLQAAWSIVNGAGRPNGGLVVDTCHFFRSESSIDLLKTIASDRIFSLQLCDAPSQPPPDLLEEAMYGRLVPVPGGGQLDLLTLLRALISMGVSVPAGPEIYQVAFESEEPQAVAQRIASACRKLLETSEGL